MCSPSPSPRGIFSFRQNTWTASEAEAVSLGGHLATINNSAENNWVFDNFASFDNQHYLWIGLNDVDQIDTWTWTSGQPVTYTNWGINEPDNPGVEDWVEMSAPQFDGPGLWNNYVDSNNEFGVPIEGVVEIVPEPTSFGLFGLAAAGVLARRRRSA